MMQRCVAVKIVIAIVSCNVTFMEDVNINFQRNGKTRIHSKSGVFAAVAIVDAKASYYRF